MAYSSSLVRKILDIGISAGGSMFQYRSSDAEADIIAAGYFSGAGAGSRHRSSDEGRAHNMRLGDVIMNVESSAGALPGRVTWHAVVNSTADQASTLASTGWVTGYDVTVSSAATT